MVHSVSGWTWVVQVKLWDPLRTRVIPEHLRGVFTTRRCTNPRLPLPYPFGVTFPLQWPFLPLLRHMMPFTTSGDFSPRDGVLLPLWGAVCGQGVCAGSECIITVILEFTTKNVTVVMHCNLRPPNVAPDVLCRFVNCIVILFIFTACAFFVVIVILLMWRVSGLRPFITIKSYNRANVYGNAAFFV